MLYDTAPKHGLYALLNRKLYTIFDNKPIGIAKRSWKLFISNSDIINLSGSFGNKFAIKFANCVKSIQATFFTVIN